MHFSLVQGTRDAAAQFSFDRINDGVQVRLGRYRPEHIPRSRSALTIRRTRSGSLYLPN
jgi:hypothetical protein